MLLTSCEAIKILLSFIWESPTLSSHLGLFISASLHQYVMCMLFLQFRARPNTLWQNTIFNFHSDFAGIITLLVQFIVLPDIVTFCIPVHCKHCFIAFFFVPIKCIICVECNTCLCLVASHCVFHCFFNYILVLFCYYITVNPPSESL